jgi:hypothetical protein
MTRAFVYQIRSLPETEQTYLLADLITEVAGEKAEE